MQHTPLQRTIRFIFFSAGFTLFVIMAFRSANQASDPQMVRGKPYLLSSAGSAQQLSGESTVGPYSIEAASVARVQQPSSQATEADNNSPSTGASDQPNSPSTSPKVMKQKPDHVAPGNSDKATGAARKN